MLKLSMIPIQVRRETTKAAAPKKIMTKPGMMNSARIRRIAAINQSTAGLIDVRYSIVRRSTKSVYVSSGKSFALAKVCPIRGSDGRVKAMTPLFLVENDSLVFVNQDPVLEVPAYGLSESEFLDVASFGDEIVYTVAVSDVCDALMDDGTLVEVCSRVVGGGSDEFDPLLVGLVVGFCSCEGRQEGVVNIDDRNADRIHEYG